MRIIALPAFCNRKLNPYNALLYTAIARAGATVDELSPRALLAKPDVLHVHWPEYFFNAPTLGGAVVRSLAFVLLIASMRARQTKVVWTIHNLHAHDRWHPRLERRMWRWFVGRVDGYIALSRGGQAAALERFPDLSDRAGFVIPHGHYRDEYPDEVAPDAARRLLDLPRDARVVCFLGAVRPYKNVPALIDAFRPLPDPDWRLVVAGKPATPDLGVDLRRRAAADPRIRLDLAYVPSERIQLYLRAADLLVFPYRDVLNSGSALLALSFDRPVLVPDLGAMADLRAAFGPAWVRTYPDPLTPQILDAAMADRPHDSRPPTPSDLEWTEIARHTLHAYDAISRPPTA